MPTILEQLITPGAGIAFTFGLALGVTYDQIVSHLGRKQP